jgi:hypothetical protein
MEVTKKDDIGNLLKDNWLIYYNYKIEICHTYNNLKGEDQWEIIVHLIY